MCHTVAQHKNLIKLFHESGNRLCPTKRVLLRAHTRQEGLCIWCNKPTFLWWEHTTEEWEKIGKLKTATREHMTPKSQGGTDADNNITCACFKCNSMRGTIPVNQFRWLSDDPKRIKRLITIRLKKRSEKNKIRKQKKEAHKLLMAEHKGNRIQKTLKQELHKENTQNHKFVKYMKKQRHLRKRSRDIRTFTKRLNKQQEWDQDHSFIKLTKRMRFLHQTRLREERAVAVALLNYMLWRYPPCQEHQKTCQSKAQKSNLDATVKKYFEKENSKITSFSLAPSSSVLQLMKSITGGIFNESNATC